MAGLACPATFSRLQRCEKWGGWPGYPIMGPSEYRGSGDSQSRIKGLRLELGLGPSTNAKSPPGGVDREGQEAAVEQVGETNQ